jgi:CheY-like chemotaxis protein
MSVKPSRILLIGTDASDGHSVREALAGTVRDRSFTVECAPHLVDGLARLRTSGIAAVLLDLRLSDVPGIAALEQVALAAPHIPILVIGSQDDEDVATAAIERGAQDDFGTGYSNLSYLQQFPTSVLKIDQSFVHEINSDPVGMSIVCAVISMGKSLRHRVVAEGVETAAQFAFLQGQQCREGQGYYVSRPLVAEQFVRLSTTGQSGVLQ